MFNNLTVPFHSKNNSKINCIEEIKLSLLAFIRFQYFFFFLNIIIVYKEIVKNRQLFMNYLFIAGT